MQLGIITGQIVSTKKANQLNGIKILIVQPLDIVTFKENGRAVASLDTVGAGEGEVVMLVNGSSARMTDTMSDKPTDSTIVAIIDSVDIHGIRVFDKSNSIKIQEKQIGIESGKSERGVSAKKGGASQEKGEELSLNVCEVENSDEQTRQQRYGKKRRKRK